MDYAHLARWALKDESPLPASWIECQNWSGALDEGVPADQRVDPGALRVFCATPDEPARLGYRRRFVESLGVVTTEEASSDAGLVVRERPVTVPQAVRDAFRQLHQTWTLPGGEVVTTVLDWARHAKELSCGFYYKWRWPDGKEDKEWLEARKAWRRFVHKTIQHSRAPAYDTELQVANAVRDGSLLCPENEYQNWVAIRDRVTPEQEVVWISEYLVDEVVAWLNARPHRDESATGPWAGVAWIEHVAFQQKLRERGCTVFGAGENEIENEAGDRNVAASLAAHKEGKNLQKAFSRCLYVTVPEGAIEFEQSLGRFHRQGQEADEVVAEMFLQCRQNWWCLEKIKGQAQYVRQTLGQKSRLELATLDVPTTEHVVVQRVQAGDPLWVDYSS